MRFDLESKLVLILIPVYKEAKQLSSLEKKSIQNTLVKFNESHSIGLLRSSKINKKSYSDCFSFEFLDFEFQFSTWLEYNTLLKNSSFYKSLNPYRYLLIVQTDAYVFSNNLSAFYQYDYVGAPWERDSLKYIQGRIGNGGFSLRNIEKISSLLQANKKMFSFRSLLHLTFKHTYKFGTMQRVNGYKKFGICQIFALLSKSVFHYLVRNSFRKAYLIDSLMEDTLYGVLLPYRFSSFKVPNVEVAVTFSIDENPNYFYQLNSNRLPLGCHAFIKNHDNFWNRFL
jgi:hypothetical protein